jgi:hypothetical protein
MHFSRRNLTEEHRHTGLRSPLKVTQQPEIHGNTWKYNGGLLEIDGGKG